jgi:uncharacterized membrane protein
MENSQLNLGSLFEKGFRLYRENLLLLIAASFVALTLSFFSAGILAGPMLSGLLLLMLLLLRRKTPKPELSDVFEGFRFFLNAGVFFFGWGLLVSSVSLILLLIPGIGLLVVLFFIYASQALLMFGPFLIVDQGMDFREASLKSVKRVKSEFWPFLSVSAVAGVIGSIGLLAFGVGVIVTFPIQACILTVAYESVMGERAEEDRSPA